MRKMTYKEYERKIEKLSRAKIRVHIPNSEEINEMKKSPDKFLEYACYVYETFKSKRKKTDKEKLQLKWLLEFINENLELVEDETILLIANSEKSYEENIAATVELAANAGFNKIILFQNQCSSIILQEIKRVCEENETECVFLGKERGEANTKMDFIYAILGAEREINSNFAVMETDRMYSSEFFHIIHDWLTDTHDWNHCLVAGCSIKDSDIQRTEKYIGTINDDFVSDIEILQNVIYDNGSFQYKGKQLSEGTTCVLNLWCFDNEYIKAMDYALENYFDSDSEEPFTLISHMNHALSEGQIKLEIAME